MPALDARIDELFTAPLAEFTAARNALAKSLHGDDAAQVKALKKPTVVAWAVNQVYWRARDVFNRVIETGGRVRKAQIAALEGKTVDPRAAAAAHRDAIAAAVNEAERLAAGEGSHPSPNALTRTFEALSLAPNPPAPFGRLSSELQPAGFEALAGVTPKARPHVAAPARAPEPAEARRPTHASHAGTHASAERRAAEEARRLEAEAKQRAAEQRRREAGIRKAEAALARAQSAERMAHDAWLRAQKAVDDARQRLVDAKSR